MEKFMEQMVDFVDELTYEDLSSDVVEHTKRLMFDTFGCALGAFPYGPPTIARSLAADVQSTTPSTVLVGGQKTSLDMATFANGVMIRYLDFNDYYFNLGGGHPSDMIAPALSVVDAIRGSGKDAILGAVIGYEIILGLADSVALRTARGWGSGGAGAVIASALVASKFLGLNKQQMEHAVSLGISSHLSLGRSRAGQISNWKGATEANDSRNGVFSALMASKGMTGPDNIFSGRNGFFEITGGPFDLQPLGGQGSPFRILGARVKGFPSGYPSHTGIQAALELRDKIKSLSDIQEIRLFTSRSGMGYANEDACWEPKTRERADHSHPFLVSLALTEGSVQVHHFEEGYYLRPDIVELMKKVQVSVGEESDNAPNVGMPLSVLEVELQSGEILTAKKGFDLEYSQGLFTDEAQENKFRPMASPLLPNEQTEKLIQGLRKLEEISDIGEVLNLSVPPT